jgi:hypothetical protein
MSPSFVDDVRAQLFLAHVEEIDDDVVLRDRRRQVVEAAPRRFELLESGIVINGVERLADLRVDLADQLGGGLEHRAVRGQRLDVVVHEQRRKRVHEPHPLVDLRVAVVEAQRQGDVAGGCGSGPADQGFRGPVGSVQQVPRRLADDPEQLLLHLFGFLS